MSPHDVIFRLRQAQVRPLPHRPMRMGVGGETLEAALQKLLANHPLLISGHQIAPGEDDPPRFVLLRKEMPILGWSLDLAYVDQNAIVTLVETKLVENPESRREVVGQIIEYAANGVEIWGEGRLREFALEYHTRIGSDLSSALQSEFGDDFDEDSFWSQVGANVGDGRIRLIVAGDEIRPEVRRMIEYLNREMKNAEVLGLEIGCYGDDDSDLIVVPVLFGVTQEIADRRRRQSPTRQAQRWTPERILEQLADTEEPTAQRINRVLTWARTNDRFIEKTNATLSFGVRGQQGKVLFSFHGGGGGSVSFDLAAFGDAGQRDRLVSRLSDLGILEGELRVDEARFNYFKKKIGKLEESDFDVLMELVEEHCGQGATR